MTPRISELSRARLPTKYGEFTIVAFADSDGRRLDHVALTKGKLPTDRPLPVRMHSECLTGDVLGSLRCDCGEQLELAMRLLAESDYGALLYLRQEGRGIGIANKVSAYALQDRGMDTVQANEHLGFDDDLRDYSVAAAMLKSLGVSSVQLQTNNPRKVNGLREAGLHVERVPLLVAPRAENRFYLATKQHRSGHLLGIEDDS